MTTPTPLTPEREREVNAVLCWFMGEGWQYFVFPLDRQHYVSDGKYGTDYPAFTRSADTLRLVEERLTPEQWQDYSNEIALFNWDAEEGDEVRLTLQTPVAVRAKCLVLSMQKRLYLTNFKVQYLQKKPGARKKMLQIEIKDGAVTFYCDNREIESMTEAEAEEKYGSTAPVASRAAALAEVVGPRNELSTETRQKIEEARRTVSSKIAPHIEATRRSERITQEDLQVCVSPDVQTEL